MEESTPMSSTPPPPYHQIPKESALKRSKIVWRALLISNLALGAYIFARARKKDKFVDEIIPAAIAPPAPVEPEPTPAVEEPPMVPPPPPIEPVRVYEPVPEDQQRELFNWMLEEKRKIKPKNREEKKKTNEEKAVLKQFIRAESLPKI